MAAISTQTLFDEASCFNCFGSLSQTQLLRLAYLSRMLHSLDPMAATDPQSLVTYGRCFSCSAYPSLGDIMELSLLDQISQNIGQSSGSCLICRDFDPNTPSTCDCGLWINTTKGAVWYWSPNPPWNPGVPEWTALIGQ